MLARLLLILFYCVYSFHSFSQCSTTVTTFPYNEGFESSNGGWASGGLASSWAWGQPNKAFINSAGGGVKCWVTGGLNGSLYTNGERSYVVSPCFDFSGLTNPVISFKIYWECENTYDGACFQSSIDNGLTWVNVGTDSEPLNCLTANWFNSPNIINLATLATPKTGWAGSVLPTSGSCQGGSGSNGWVIAKHCLNGLGGQALVRFRFAFGAGTACNAFDGVAFDDILIENAAPNQANFSFACTANPLQYQFSNLSTSCPNNFVWNFGDPASGANNGTGQQNPTHTFSAPGTYQVTLTVSGPCGGSSSITKTVSTVGASLNVTQPSCINGLVGSITMNASNLSGTSNFVLLPGGITNTTGLFTGLSGGSYTVQVTDAIGCSTSASTQLNAALALSWAVANAVDISCHGLQDGKIVTTLNGGSGPLQYLLNPLGITNSTGTFTNLNAGTYTVVATDNNGCTLTSSFLIIIPPEISLLTSTSSNILCNGLPGGTISLNYIGGTGALFYTLSPGSLSNASGIFNNLMAGTYTVVCADNNGCSKNTSFQLTEPPPLIIDSISIQAPGCNPNNNGTLTCWARGGTLPLNYAIGGGFSGNPNFSSMTSGNYTVVVKDANGCTISSVAILQSINAPVISQVMLNPITCSGRKDASLQITAIGNTQIQSYSLSPGSFSNSNGLFNDLGPGNYLITVSDADGCTQTSSISISDPPLLTIDNLKIIVDSCSAQSANRLLCNVSGGTGVLSYSLQPGNIIQSGPLFNNLLPGIYYVTIKDANGCSSSSRIEIPEKACCDGVFLPNAFSPNRDGLNDEFGAKQTAGIVLQDFLIFNRWGEVVFRGANSEDSWNGRYKGEDAETGTYYYMFRYKCLSSGKLQLLKGDLVLIR